MENLTFNKIIFDKQKEITFEAKINYINTPLLYYLAYSSWDEDGFEYPYNLFEFARNPLIIDKLKNL